jgi:hypothetical protein
MTTGGPSNRYGYTQRTGRSYLQYGTYCIKYRKHSTGALQDKVRSYFETLPYRKNKLYLLPVLQQGTGILRNLLENNQSSSIVFLKKGT